MAKAKNTAAAKRQYDKGSFYSPEDAAALVKSMAFAKFDESVDAVFALGIDARKADQLVRGTVSLPHGTGKDVRVIAFVGGEKLAGSGDVVLRQRFEDPLRHNDGSSGADDIHIEIGKALLEVIDNAGCLRGCRGGGFVIGDPTMNVFGQQYRLAQVAQTQLGSDQRGLSAS